MREAELRILRELDALRAHQFACEAILVLFTAGLLRDAPDASAVLDAVGQGLKFPIEYPDQTKAETFRMMVEENFQRIADDVKKTIEDARVEYGA
jgi:hypothetical protein